MDEDLKLPWRIERDESGGWVEDADDNMVHIPLSSLRTEANPELCMVRMVASVNALSALPMEVIEELAKFPAVAATRLSGD